MVECYTPSYYSIDLKLFLSGFELPVQTFKQQGDVHVKVLKPEATISQEVLDLLSSSEVDQLYANDLDRFKLLESVNNQFTKLLGARKFHLKRE